MTMGRLILSSGWRVLVLCLILVGIVHLYLFAHLGQRAESKSGNEEQPYITGHKSTKNNNQETDRLTARILTKINNTDGEIVQHSLNVTHVSPTTWASLPKVKDTGNLEEIMSVISEINKKQLIVNFHKFSGFTWDGTIIIVQVHTRANYLHHLIESLRKTAGISEILLIFSHDYYSDEVNEVIQKVDFCQVSWFKLCVTCKKYGRTF